MITQQLEEDCNILLKRALLNKQLCAFGEDGFGKYGRSTFGQQFTITHVAALVTSIDDGLSGDVLIKLEGYDSHITGHIMTDRNFEISLGSLLRAANIDVGTLTWPDTVEEQGRAHVIMNIDVEVLLGWK